MDRHTDEWRGSLIELLGCSYKCTLLQWHNERDSVSNHQPYDCLLTHLFKAQIKETSKLRVTGLCAGNSPLTGEFPAQRASNVENVSIWWRHHDYLCFVVLCCNGIFYQYPLGLFYGYWSYLCLTTIHLYWRRIQGHLWIYSRLGN